MKYLEKHPMIVVCVGIVGISLSAIFVRYSVAPSAVLAAWRLLWTVILMTPVVLGKKEVRQEFAQADKKSILLIGRYNYDMYWLCNTDKFSAQNLFKVFAHGVGCVQIKTWTA